MTALTITQPLGVEMANAKLCSVHGCDKRTIARSMCGKHYQRWRKDADPAEVRSSAKPGEPGQWIADLSTYEGDDCKFWPFGTYSTGYGALNLTSGGTIMASRRMCEVANGPAPSSTHQAAHRCGNGRHGCMTPKHLYWATRAENEGDKVEHGTSNRGDGNGHAKLTERDVREIRSSTAGPSALARQFGISAPTVCDIRAGRSWSWLK